MKIKSQSSGLTFWEATGIIVGHGVGSGILAVPWLASHSSIFTIIAVIALCYLFNLLLHLIIAELSLNNGGAQFVSCLENELFGGKVGKLMSWIAFALIGLSVLVNVSAFLTGASAVFTSWFGLERRLGMILFYVLGAGVVFAGLKLVGICEKYAVFAMVGVVFIMLAATLGSEMSPLPTVPFKLNNAIALFGMVSFSLSAVMSTPQVVKGLNGDPSGIRASIAAGLAVNVGLIFIVTLITLLGAGKNITSNGALVDLADHLGGWVGIVGYIFTLLALATSFWANTLNLRDIINEQTHWGDRLSWLTASLPCLVIALFSVTSFVGLTRFASIIQVVTGMGIILAYNRSRKRSSSQLIGRFGALVFQVMVILGTLLATVGSVIKVG